MNILQTIRYQMSVRFVLKYIKSTITISYRSALSLFNSALSWKTRVTDSLLGLFWIIDLPIVVITVGCKPAVFHDKAVLVWFERRLMIRAEDNDPDWAKELRLALREVVIGNERS